MTLNIYMTSKQYYVQLKDMKLKKENQLQLFRIALLLCALIIISKERLQSSLKDSCRRDNLKYVKVELQTWVNIYKKCPSIDHNNI